MDKDDDDYEIGSYEDLAEQSRSFMGKIDDEFEKLVKISKYSNDGDGLDFDKDDEIRKTGENIWSLLDPRISVCMYNILACTMEKVRLLNQMKEEKLPVIQYLDIWQIGVKNEYIIGHITVSLKWYIERRSLDIEQDDDDCMWLEGRSDEVVGKMKEYKKYLDKSDKIRNGFLKEVKKAYEIYRVFESQIMPLTDNNQYDLDSLQQPIEEYISGLARDMEEGEYKAMKRMVMKMKKNRADALGRVEWTRMLELEEKAMKLAAEKRLLESKDADLAYIEYEDRLEMDKNHELIADMLNVLTDDDLYDLCTLNDDDNFTITFIYSSNIKLFARLVLRANIIRSEMYPELKPKYNEWINGKETKAEEPKCKMSPELMTPEAIVQWKKLYDKDIVDENYMPIEKSGCKAAIVANRMMEVLSPAPRWAAFEQSWGIDNLANKLVRARDAQYFPGYDKKIRKILE